MALEDAGTLAKALALSLKDSPNDWNVRHLETLSQWQTHRQERIAKIAELSARGGNMRRATTSVWQQVLRDWTLWMVFRWAGSAERMKWIYLYKVEEANCE
jgi:2-polyprenyl-6-methoxyphenol hydroxylase-like FAD-dependent oxidoreductase